MKNRPLTLASTPADGIGWWRSLPILGSHLATRTHWGLLFACTLITSLGLAIGMALTARPWCDESWFASPAYNLARHGFMGTTIVDSHGFIFARLVEGLDRFTYWIMPGYIFVQAAWYKILGFSLLSDRMISMAWAAVALCAWFTIVHRLTNNRNVALLAVVLLATEEHFVLSAATARMDMMCAALNLSSAALYLRLRANVLRAATVAGGVAAAAIFTHPNGIIAFAMLAVFLLYFDRVRLTWKLVLCTAAPALIFAFLWGLYIRRAPDLFLSQMESQANVPHRFAFSVNIFQELGAELTRYNLTYGLIPNSPLFPLRIVFYSYLLAVIATLAIPRLRRQPGALLLLSMTGGTFIWMMFLQKSWYYLIFILPLLTALLALFMNWLWQRSLLAKWAVCLQLFLIVGLNVGVLGVRMYHDTYHNRFLPAAEYIKRNASPGDLVIGSGELAFALGFEGQVVDDSRLGTSSGRVPEFIVMEPFYANLWAPWFFAVEPDTWQKMSTMLGDQYEVVYDQTNDRYRVWGFSDKPYRIFRKRRSVEP